MKKTILVDPSRCLRCSNCWVACKDEHCGNDWSPITAPQGPDQWWVRVDEMEKGSGRHMHMFRLPIMCQHCEECALIKIAPDAVYRREDGIVIIDPEAAKGRPELVDACPYHTVFWNEELELPQKCTMCAHLLDAGWEQPRCVDACPADALMFVDVDELTPENLHAPLEVLHPEYETVPFVAYENLPKIFAAGEVASADLKDVIEEVHITATHQVTGESFEAWTNTLGDFRLSVGMPGFYTISFMAQGYKRKVLKDVDLRDSLNLDVVKMDRRVDAADAFDEKKMTKLVKMVVGEALSDADWTTLLPQMSIDVRPGLFGSAKVTGLAGGENSTANHAANKNEAHAAPVVEAEEAEPQKDADDDRQVFEVNVQTPIGTKGGRMVIWDIKDGTFKGTFTLMGKTGPMENGKIDDEGNFEADSEVNSPLGKMPAHTSGTIKDGKVEAVSSTKMGDFAITSK